MKLILSLCALMLMAVPAAAQHPEPPFQVVFPQDHTITTFTDSFGAPRSAHRHLGNDLMAPKMTEVYAIADGVVTAVRHRGNAGRYVLIDHGDGWESWYMHLNIDNPGTSDGAAPLRLGVAVELGEAVVAGQLIGWVGDSGNARGGAPHTHFELHYRGRPLDPYPYLVEAFERAVAGSLEPRIGPHRTI